MPVLRRGRLDLGSCSEAEARAAALASVRAYREAMAGFAGMRTLDTWYAQLPEDQLMAAIRGTVADMTHGVKGKREKKEAKAAEKAVEHGEKMARKARTRDSLQALSKLAERAGGRYQIISQPPVIVPARDLAATYGISADEIGQVIRGQLRAYQATLQLDRRHLLEHFEIVDMARKVDGVGSVGTGPTSCCCKDATPMTRCSCRSRRPPPRCWRTTCPRAASPSPASASCRDSG